MAKERKYYYQCVFPCDLPYYGPDNRKERFIRKGNVEVPNPHTLHSIRCLPSGGINARGEELPPHYICVPQPLGKQYTEVIEKKVARAKLDLQGHVVGHKMVTKTSKVKFELLDPEDITDYIRKNAYNFGDAWGPEMFQTINSDVLPDKRNRPMPTTGDEDKDSLEEEDAGT